MFDINKYIQSKEYSIFMFKHHCESLKLGVAISTMNRNTKEIYHIRSFDELAKSSFPDLDIQTKLAIKKEVGL